MENVVPNVPRSLRVKKGSEKMRQIRRTMKPLTSSLRKQIKRRNMHWHTGTESIHGSIFVY